MRKVVLRILPSAWRVAMEPPTTQTWYCRANSRSTVTEGPFSGSTKSSMWWNISSEKPADQSSGRTTTSGRGALAIAWANSSRTRLKLASGSQNAMLV